MPPPCRRIRCARRRSQRRHWRGGSSALPHQPLWPPRPPAAATVRLPPPCRGILRAAVRARVRRAVPALAAAPHRHRPAHAACHGPPADPNWPSAVPRPIDALAPAPCGRAAGSGTRVVRQSSAPQRVHTHALACTLWHARTHRCLRCRAARSRRVHPPPSQRMLGLQPKCVVEASHHLLHQWARMKVSQGLGARRRTSRPLGPGRRPRDDTEDGKAGPESEGSERGEERAEGRVRHSDENYPLGRANAPNFSLPRAFRALDSCLLHRSSAARLELAI